MGFDRDFVSNLIFVRADSSVQTPRFSRGGRGERKGEKKGKTCKRPAADAL